MTEETTLTVTYSVANGSSDIMFNLVVFDPLSNPLGHIHATMDCEAAQVVDPCPSWNLVDKPPGHVWMTAATSTYNAS